MSEVFCSVYYGTADPVQTQQEIFRLFRHHTGNADAITIPALQDLPAMKALFRHFRHYYYSGFAGAPPALKALFRQLRHYK